MPGEMVFTLTTSQRNVNPDNIVGKIKVKKHAYMFSTFRRENRTHVKGKDPASVHPPAAHLLIYKREYAPVLGVYACMRV